MKKIKVIIFIVGLSLIFSAKSYSESGIGIILGLSTPNNEINDIYNKNTISEQNLLGKLYRDGTKSGYHLGAKLRLPVGSNLTFIASIMWNRFPQTDLTIPIPNGQKIDTVTLQTTQNIFPIAIGLNYYLFHQVVGLYGTGELTYNYMLNSVDYKRNDIGIPLTSITPNPADSRIGFGIGAGIDFSIIIANANIEAKYNVANLFGRVNSNEKLKTYITLSLGIFFGGI